MWEQTLCSSTRFVGPDSRPALTTSPTHGSGVALPRQRTIVPQKAYTVSVSPHESIRPKFGKRSPSVIDGDRIDFPRHVRPRGGRIMG